MAIDLDAPWDGNVHLRAQWPNGMVTDLWVAACYAVAMAAYYREHFGAVSVTAEHSGCAAGDA